jgi:hypothetical protein
MQRFRMERAWPLVAVAGIFAAVFSLTLLFIYSYNDGRFVYVLDDAYIHMAVAKHMAQNGVWGITRGAFTSLSSSPLWTLLLASVFRLAGPGELLPLAMNGIAALAVLGWFHVLMLRIGLPSAQRFFLLLAFLFLTPLTSAVFTGQEHVLHVGLALWLAWAAARALAPAAGEGTPAILAVCLPAFLATSARYESAFLVAAAALLFFIKREYRNGTLTALAGALPIFIYGAVSAAFGWSWLPTSILLKGNTPDWHSPAKIAASLGYAGYRQLLSTPHLLFPVLGALLLLIFATVRASLFRSRAAVLAALFTLTTLLHLQYARTGWFYRYEAYLVGLGVLTLAAGLPGLRASWRPLSAVPKALAAVLCVAAGLPLAVRGYGALVSVPAASRNIYEQQIQTATFLHLYYDGQSVAANDIGAINFFADLRCLDLWGLASRDVAALKLHGRYTTDAIASLARSAGARIAVVYDPWFLSYGGLPVSWIKAGTWRIRDNIVCGVDTLSFYALSPEEAESLKTHLREFAPHLPARVIQAGPYLQ